MKITHKKNLIQEKPFPKLMISDTGNVVLFSEDEVGTLVAAPSNNTCPHHSDEWYMPTFKDLPVGNKSY